MLMCKSNRNTCRTCVLKTTKYNKKIKRSKHREREPLLEGATQSRQVESEHTCAEMYAPGFAAASPSLNTRPEVNPAFTPELFMEFKQTAARWFVSEDGWLWV